jgi:integrase
MSVGTLTILCMGTEKKRRRKGEGGLYIIHRKVWNELKQQDEIVEMYQATKEVDHPTDPFKRKTITGTGHSPSSAQSNLNRSLNRHYRKKGFLEAGVKIKSRVRGLQSVSEYLEEWYSELSTGSTSPQYRYKMRGHINNHLSPHIGRTALADLEYKHLQELFYVTLPGKKKMREGIETEEQLLGVNGLLGIYKTLSNALKIAVKKGKIDRNPLELVTPPKYQKPEENIPHLMHVIFGMLRLMQENNDPAYQHFILALMGLRRGERLGLTFSNLKLQGNNPTMTIKNQLQRVTGVGLVMKPATKNGKSRQITLSEPFLGTLKQLKELRKEQRKLPSFQPKQEFADLVFLKDNGNPWDPNDDNEYWREVNQKYNTRLGHIRGHALRHIAATYMSDEGIEEAVAKEVLGHESEAMMWYYRRITANKQQGQVAKYGQSLSERIRPRGGEKFTIAS